MDRPQLIRHLRIAVSVSFAVVAAALCVLWMRSYSEFEQVSYAGSTIHIRVGNWRGIGIISLLPVHSEGTATTWMYESAPYAGNILNAKLLRKPVSIWRPVFALASTKTKTIAVMMSVPIWMLLACCTSLAVWPWLKLSFSLRALLIATTLVAVVLGLGVWAAE